MKQQNPAIPVPNPYTRKLNGYRCSHRNRWLLLQNRLITFRALFLFEFYLDIFDFDPKHDLFGTFKVEFKNIASFFDVAENSIRSWHKELIELGLIRKTHERNLFKITNCKRYLPAGFWQGEASHYSKQESHQSIEVIAQSIGIGLQPGEENSQPVEHNLYSLAEYNPSIALVSSKYQSINNQAMFTEEDKEWLSGLLPSDNSNNE